MAHPVPSTVFPKTETFTGWNEPARYEADVRSLEIEGQVPADLDGTFYRIQPDSAYPPRFEDDVPLNGDGNVTSFVFKNGHVDFKNRYVRTAKFVAEHEARKTLIGRYRNRYTDDPLVKDIITRTTSNTHIVYHAGKLMSLKEDGPPYELDPVTLETRKIVDYNGRLRSPTHTAHPKMDEKTGEMIAFGYEAKGDATCDICYFMVDKTGVLFEEVWFTAPYACMIHDFFATENYVIFPLGTLKSDIKQMKEGGEHFFYDEKQDYQLLGVLPRRGAKPDDVKWFKTPRGFWVHTINAYEEDGDIILDASVWNDCIFPFFPNSEGVKFTQNPAKMTAPVFRYRVNPQADPSKMLQPEILLNGTFEFPRIDDRATTQRYESYWILSSDPAKFSHGGQVMFQGGMNVLNYHHIPSNTTQSYWPGHSQTLQEPVFVPRYEGADIDDGYLLMLSNRWVERRDDLLMFDAKNIGKGPIATIKVPLRLRDGLHGSWVQGSDIRKAKAVGLEENGTNGVNGGNSHT